MSNNSHFLWLDSSDRKLWTQGLDLLPLVKRDIYYNPDYINLYARNRDKVNCYMFFHGDKIYVYPFIASPVPEINGYFDISTAYGYGGPVSNSDDQTFLKEAYSCFIEESRKNKIIAELIKFHPLLKNHLLLNKHYNGVIKEMCSTVYVDVNLDEKYRWEKIYTHSNRKNINKAKRYDLNIRLGHDDELWTVFQELYINTMRANKANSSHYYRKEYFNDVRKNLADNYILISCENEGKIITVMLVLLGTDYAHCHLIGTNREYNGLGINNLLHHELILWCKKNGYSKLHLGGGRENNEDDSLLRFKKNFSDKIISFYIGEHVLNEQIYNKLCQKFSKTDEENKIDKLFKYRQNH